jgi:hypothetical protein
VTFTVSIWILRMHAGIEEQGAILNFRPSLRGSDTRWIARRGVERRG